MIYLKYPWNYTHFWLLRDRRRKQQPRLLSQTSACRAHRAARGIETLWVLIQLRAMKESQVRKRDGRMCKLTGIIDATKLDDKETEAARSLPFHQEYFELNNEYQSGGLEVTHAIPWNPGNDPPYQFSLVLKSFTGLTVDVSENMVLLDSSVHKDFGAFKIFFDAYWNAHARTGPARPTHCNTFDVPRRNYKKLSRVIGRNLDLSMERYDNNERKTADPPSPFWFQLHRLLGDIYHASGQAESIENLLDKADEAGPHELCTDNLVTVDAAERLQTPTGYRLEWPEAEVTFVPAARTIVV
ncbi:hypothetical protein FB451DRAFT_1373475 [Mycena latifolia]|nr:hypothetical protein FB451DRAFT_1373475 [Mycena latifolia]